MEDYKDMLCTPHPAARRPMPRGERAAQFAPFAALTGLDASMAEAARLTDRCVPLSDEEQAALDKALCRLQEHLADRPTVTLLCFEADASKDGGRYITVTGRVRVIDTVLRELILTDQRRIPLDAVRALGMEQ